MNSKTITEINRNCDKLRRLCVPSREMDRRGHAIVAAILRHAIIERRHESVAHSKSPVVWVMQCLQLGAIIPTTGRTEPDYDGLPPRETLPTLSHDAQRVADAIAEDGRGDEDKLVQIGPTTIGMCLEQRMGWMLGTSAQREKWLAKVLAKDKTPALEGMLAEGRKQLAVLFESWDRATVGVAA